MGLPKRTFYDVYTLCMLTLLGLLLLVLLLLLLLLLVIRLLCFLFNHHSTSVG